MPRGLKTERGGCERGQEQQQHNKQTVSQRPRSWSHNSNKFSRYEWMAKKKEGQQQQATLRVHTRTHACRQCYVCAHSWEDRHDPLLLSPSQPKKGRREERWYYWQSRGFFVTGSFSFVHIAYTTQIHPHDGTDWSTSLFTPPHTINQDQQRQGQQQQSAKKGPRECFFFFFFWFGSYRSELL